MRFPAGWRIVPLFAFAHLPVEIPGPLPVLAERRFDGRQGTVMMPRGAFAAWEQPALLAEDVRTFFWMVRE